jgi:hypothetical protein
MRKKEEGKRRKEKGGRRKEEGGSLARVPCRNPSPGSPAIA